MSCISKRPVAKIRIESKGDDAVWLNNVSQYNDQGCPLSSRLARWVIYKNGRKVKDFGFKPLSEPIELGALFDVPDFEGNDFEGDFFTQTQLAPSQSNGNAIKLPLGAASVWQYLTYINTPLSSGDIIQVGVFVRNCKHQTSKVSNLYTLPPFGNCTDCCCDNGYVFQVGGEDFCANTQVANQDFCLTF
jgi:hypothetical protein